VREVNGMELKVLENGLVPVYESGEMKRFVNAREMHGYLEVGRDFSNWIKDRIEKYGFEEGTDYIMVFANFGENSELINKGGRPTKEYHLALDAAKEVAMVENNEKGRMVRKYFIEVEKRYSAQEKKRIADSEATLKRADAMLNNSRVRMAKFIRETVKDIWDILSPEARQTYSAYVIERTTGQPGLIPLPVVEKTYTASDLAQEFGVSANMIGRIANANGVKTPENGMEVLDKAKGHDKQIPTFRYNEKGRETLRVLIGRSMRQ
jgi:phage anti-repressor protein